MIAQLSSEKANMQVSVIVYLNSLCPKMEWVNLLFHFSVSFLSPRNHNISVKVTLFPVLSLFYHQNYQS